MVTTATSIHQLQQHSNPVTATAVQSSTSANASNQSTSASPSIDDDDIAVAPQDTIEMPLSSINKIVKQSLPSNVQLSREVKQALSRSAGIFILYITNSANEQCTTSKPKRSTVTANDVLSAIKECEYPQFIPALQHFLQEYRADQQQKKAKLASGGSKGNKRAAAAATNSPNTNASPSSPPSAAAAKKPRTDQS